MALETIIDAASIFVEPFEYAGLDNIGLWLLVTWVATVLVSFLLDDVLEVRDRELIFEKLDDIEPGPLAANIVIVFAPVVEEIAFRWLPVYFDLSMPVIVGASLLWVVGHGKTAPETLLMVPILLKLVLGGFILEAIVVHALVNAVGYVIQSHQYRKQGQSEQRGGPFDDGGELSR